MPAVLIKNVNLPDAVREKLDDLDNELKEGDVTTKGYCKKKWRLLESHVSPQVARLIQSLQTELEASILSESQYCVEVMKLLELSQCTTEAAKLDNDADCATLSASKKPGSTPLCNQSPSKAMASTTTPVKREQLETTLVSSRPPRTSTAKKQEEATSGSSKQSRASTGKKQEEATSGSSKQSRASTGKKQEEATPGSSKQSRASAAKKQEEATPGSSKQSSRVAGPSTSKRSNSQTASVSGQRPGCSSERKSPRASSTTAQNGKNGGPMSGQASIESFFSAALKKETTATADCYSADSDDEAMDVEPRTNGVKEDLDKEATNGKLPSPAQAVSEEVVHRKNKKVKLEEDDEDKDEVDAARTVEGKKKEVSRLSLPPTKCKICHQLLNDPDLHIYQGHPSEAVEEYVALTHPKLSLFTGDEDMINENDERPQNKLTGFSVYDKEGHLCPFDNGLIERNVLLYMSGYIKPVYEECSEAEGGIPTKDMGPINEWWVSGFDGGELALIGFSTAYGEYYLMAPSEEYAPFMGAVREKICLSKVVIEFMLDEVNPSYEDLLNKLAITVPPNGVGSFTEDMLLKHAQFVCDQVMSFDAAALADEPLLIVTSCMRSLINLSGVTFGKRRAMRRAERKGFKERKATKATWSKATTTELVQDVFETFFTEQLDKEGDKDGDKGPRRRRCGVCEACQQPDCGTCVQCKNMIKFGGTGTSKQACDQRRCPNMAIQEADDSEPEDEEDYRKMAEVSTKTTSWRDSHKSVRIRNADRDVSWVGEAIVDDGRKTFYSSVKVAKEEVRVNDCVMVEANDPSVPLFIARVKYMWQDNRKGSKHFHAQWFCRGSDTVIGETADPMELYLVDECEDCLMTTISRKVNVDFRAVPDNWAMLGGEPLKEERSGEGESKMFFYQKHYNLLYARFEDPPEDPPSKNPASLHKFCASCERTYLEEQYNSPQVAERVENERDEKLGDLYAVVLWRGQEFRVGSSVFLEPDTFKFHTSPPEQVKKEKQPVNKFDEEVYPEFYRKHTEHVGGNEETGAPFNVGCISAIATRGSGKLTTASDITIRVTKFYRPENTHRGSTLSQQMDLNKLYWSSEEKVINFSAVVGKCYVVCADNLEDMTVAEWMRGGPHRFYFSQAYDASSQAFTDPPNAAVRIGCTGSKGKGKGKGKGKSSVIKAKEEDKKAEIKYEEWPPVSAKLRSLDVFAGCGGLSEGLHQSGVADSHWAIEKEEPAANAFKLNNPKATVFTEDCNLLLKLAMCGEHTNDKGQVLPKRGEVELLCGGPPCQGFSGMNRFNSRQYSLFKNSLIVSYLAYCDYYRPRYFILENVRNFVSFKSSIVLKLTLRCLLRMGYQCTFGVLQAGNYGVPQTRRRAIILAAAPGEKLPRYPEPTHVFSRRGCQLSVVVDNKKYTTNCEWDLSAPYRTITVRDAMSDLPAVRNGHNKDEMPYGGEPLSHFQRLIRGDQYQPHLRDHICKVMAPTTEARIANVPTAPGSDWRDLPNIVVRLNDGNFTKKLQYTHHDKKCGKSSTGALRGVCACASGKPCDPMDRQFNTLIPWCLPHTGNRHNNWAGLYGRLEWDGYFKTTVTNPEPMGKQGRVLHPEQTRVVTVRECARSQGFPDTYRFYGTILDKHRQVGNAVPPPMGAAIGLEIRKCVSAVELKKRTTENKMELDE